MSQLYEKLHEDMINILELSVDPKFNTEINHKLESIKIKLNSILKFKEDIAIEGLKVLEKVKIYKQLCCLINYVCI